MKAFVRCMATGHEYPLCAVSTDEFDDLMESRRADFFGVPMFYDASDHTRVWPLLMHGYSANFCTDRAMFTLFPPVLLKDIMADLGTVK